MLSTKFLFFFYSFQALAAPFNAYVNGGGEVYSNSWLHEQDILAFQHGLFDGNRSVILSLDGANAKYVDTDESGQIIRRPDDYVQLKDSEIGKSVKPATRENVNDIYRTIATSHPPEALIVYGDHGNSTALSLWKEILPSKDHFTLQKSIPEKTLLRSIYIECFAGALLVDQTRGHMGGGEVSSFLNKYYPKNKCGFALSKHNEMGQYINKNGYKDSPWTKYFSSATPPNLAGLKSFLNQDAKIAPTCVLTSDYLLDDVADFVCSKEPLNNNCLAGQVAKGLKEIEKSEIVALCAVDTETKIQAAESKVQDEANLNMSFPLLGDYWAAEYMKSKDPALVDKIGMAQQLQYLKYQIELPENSGKRDQLQKEIDRFSKAVDKDFPKHLRDETERLTSGQDPDFVRYFDQKCSQEWLSTNEMPLHLVLPDAIEIWKTLSFKGNCRQEMNAQSGKLRQAQLEYKQKNLENQQRKQVLLGSILNNPRFRAIKDRYENIKKCETSSLK